MGGVGVPELLVIFLVVLLLFGAKRIPEIARGLGKGIREFKDATNEIKHEITAEPTRYQIPQSPPAQTQPSQPYQSEVAAPPVPPAPPPAEGQAPGAQG